MEIPAATSNSENVIYLLKQSKSSLIKCIVITPKPANILGSTNIQLHITYTTGTREYMHFCLFRNRIVLSSCQDFITK